MTKTLTVLASGMLLFAGVAAQAAEHGVGYAVKGPVLQLTPGKNGGSSGLTITSISAGSSGATPEYNGAGEGYVDLPWLQDVVNASSSITVTVQMQSLTYTNAPAVFLSVMQNGKVLSTSEVVFPFDLVANEEALCYYPMTAPSTTGSTQLLAQIYQGQTLIAQEVYNIYVN